MCVYIYIYVCVCVCVCPKFNAEFLFPFIHFWGFFLRISLTGFMCCFYNIWYNIGIER